VINEVAAKRLQKALQGKGLQYALHFLESRDTHLEQDVVFLSNKSSGNIANIEASHPIDPIYPSKCAILTCLINGEKTAIIGLHLKAVPTEPSAVAKREKQADAVVKQLNRLSVAGYATLVLGDLNDWDSVVPDADPSEQATPTSQALKKMKDYVPGGDNELVNSLRWVEPIEKRYTYNYKGSKTVLDHILLPLGWQNRVSGVTIDHDRPDGASDHWPVILDLSW
jgi:endonuclease/exonuclease/phosphatase family metal-dependent hydrolase